MAARASGGSAAPRAAARSSRSLIDASGLRTSCATPATTRPSAASRSFCASSRASRSWSGAPRPAAAPALAIPSAMSSSSRTRERGTGAVRSLPSAASAALQPGGRPLDRDQRVRGAGDQQQRRERQRDHQEPPALQASATDAPDRPPRAARRPGPGATARHQLPAVDLGFDLGGRGAAGARAAAVDRIASRQDAGTAAAICAGAVAAAATPAAQPDDRRDGRGDRRRARALPADRSRRAPPRARARAAGRG